MTSKQAVTGHYARRGIAETILAAVGAGLAPGEESAADHLAPADEFHIGGIEATRRIVSMLGLRAGMEVLDIGCGIGGTARVIAHGTGARVTGIDLTADYVEAAGILSQAVGLGDVTRFVCANALALPLADSAFDAAVSFHVAMNIADKGGFYHEAARVLRPGAVLGIYDVLAGPGQGSLAFPVPWAADSGASWLAGPDAMRTLLDDAGFDIVHEEDRHAQAQTFLARAASAGTSPVGLHLLIGEGFAERMANLAANLATQRCGPWEFVCRRR